MGSQRLAAAAQQPGSAAVLTAQPCLTNSAADAIPLRPILPPVLQQVQDERKDPERDCPAAAIAIPLRPIFPLILNLLKDESTAMEQDCPAAAAIPLRPILPPVLQQVQDERKDPERDCPAAAIPLRPILPPVLQQVQDERKNRERICPAAAVPTFPLILNLLKDALPAMERDCPAAAIPAFPLILNLLKDEHPAMKQDCPAAAIPAFPLILNLLKDEPSAMEWNCPDAAIATFPLILNLLKDESPARERDCPAATVNPAAPRYDYLLVVGPGRSGSDFLYRQLQAHPQLAFPEIKEGYYYRSIRRYRKFHPPLGKAGPILADIANLAYQDPELPGGVARLQAAGARILLVVLLRQHWDRAISMLAFRQSRGEYPLGRGGQPLLAAAVLRDRLTPEQLGRLYQMDTDVLTLHFPALVGNPAETLAALAAVCGLDNFPPPQTGVVNPAAKARNFLLARLGRFAARAMRRMGLRRALQRVKDNPRLMNLFFPPRPPAEPLPELPAASRDCLEQTYRECCALTAAAPAEKIAAGVYFRRAAAAAATPPVESGGPS